MSFGAHEAMETHEILLQKINTITHFNLYAREARNPQLREMISRHQQAMIQSYNECVGLSRGNGRFSPISPSTNLNMRGVSHQQVQYGLHNPQQIAPQADASMSDAEVAIAMLQSHKNGAKNAMSASLECADPNLRRALMNSAINCNQQAYETFFWMNQQGVYQVPTLNSHTAQTLLNSYQPVGAGMQAQFGMNAGNVGAGFGNVGGGRDNVQYGAGVGTTTFGHNVGAQGFGGVTTGQIQ